MMEEDIATEEAYFHPWMETGTQGHFKTHPLLALSLVGSPTLSILGETGGPL